MAKQTFSVGQVLTAAQMTSLQQTAMLGGSATAKTASYTLVAADAGTVVSVNSTSATTITVNTGLFSAGDTVTIQNWGSGAVTITAGTATVNTAGSLIVPQYDGGVLYFTSASAAIYFDFVQAGAVSPLTTKGDLYTFSTSDARLPVGTNGHTLVADSAEATGLKWAAPASGGGMTLLSTTALSGTSVTISSISSSYNHLYIVVYGVEFSGGNSSLQWSTNISGSVYTLQQIALTNIVAGQRNTVAFNNYDDTVEQPAATGGANTLTIQIQNYANTSARKNFLSQFGFNGTSSNGRYVDYNGFINSTTAINSFTFTTNLARTFTAGTLLMYGVK